MSKRSLFAVLIPVFACTIVSAQESYFEDQLLAIGYSKPQLQASVRGAAERRETENFRVLFVR